MAVRLGPFFVIIILMVILSRPKDLSWDELGDHIEAFILEYPDQFFDDIFFIVAFVENCGEVLRTNIRTLAIGLGPRI